MISNNKLILSIVLPVYNVEKYLICCMQSILSQITDVCEVVLVDDGSTDSSGKLCNDYEEQYNFIKVLHHSNTGSYKTRLDGARVADGEYIWFVDSDDWITAGAIQGVLDLISSYNCPDILIFGYLVNGKTQCAYSTVFNGESCILDNKYDIYKLLCATNELNAVWRKCIKRNLVIENDMLYDIENFSFGEDLYISSAVLNQADKIVLAKKNFYSYRFNTESITHRYNPNRIKNERFVLTQMNELAMNWDSKDGQLISLLDKKIQSVALENIRFIIESDLNWSEKYALVDNNYNDLFWKKYYQIKDYNGLNKREKEIFSCLNMGDLGRKLAFKWLYAKCVGKRGIKKVISK